MTTKAEFKEFALKNGMRLCVVCKGEVVGGCCPPCGKVICYPCSTLVTMTTGEMAYRCRECAAEIVLKGDGAVGLKRPGS